MAHDSEPGKASPGELVLKPTGSEFTFQGLAPSIIGSGVDPNTGDRTLSVADPMVRSESRLAPDGLLSVTVQGGGSIGRQGEARAMDVLSQRLRDEGHSVTTLPAADHKGEDGVVVVDEARFTVQLVTTPQAPEFWREAHLGSAMTQVQISQATDWLRNSIDDKASTTPPQQRPTTILAIDARHVGVLGSPAVVTHYTSRFPEPSLEFRFASVWIVGPLAEHCARIGIGTP